MAEFSELLKRYRERSGKNTTELGYELKVTANYLAQLEAKLAQKKTPSYELVVRLAKALGLSPEEKKEFFESAGFGDLIYESQKIPLSGPIETSLIEAYRKIISAEVKVLAHRLIGHLERAENALGEEKLSDILNLTINLINNQIDLTKINKAKESLTKEFKSKNIKNMLNELIHKDHKS